MSKPANKTMIGTFVVVAVVLAVAAVVLFGSGKFFQQTERWIVFFEGSVKGLNVGSPVVFRGVQIGQVTDIIVGFDTAKIEVIIPVIFEIDPEKFKDIGLRVERSDEEMVRALIERGLRAQLQMQSMVTGQLVINIDFLPNTEARLKGLDRFADKITLEGLNEIPSVPTPMQRLEKTKILISKRSRMISDGPWTVSPSWQLHRICMQVSANSKKHSLQLKSWPARLRAKLSPWRPVSIRPWSKPGPVSVMPAN